MSEHTQTPDPTPKPAMRRWVRVVFGLSLALNLLVFGVIGGAILRFGDKWDGYDAPVPGMALVWALPEEQRRGIHAELRRSARSHFKEHGSDFRDRNQNLAKAVGEALRAEPFDPEEVEELLEDREDYRDRWKDEAFEAVLERVAAMSPADRKAYAARVEQALSKPWKHDRKGRRHDRD